MCYIDFMGIDEEKGLERPRLTTKGLVTRQKIIQAAADLICDRGIAGVCIEDIQKAANVGASQVYHYFSSKQELVHAAIDLQTQAILEGQQPFLINLTSFEALQAWGRILVAMQKNGQNPLGLILTSMANELSGPDTQVRFLISEGFSRWENHLTEGLTKMRDHGILNKKTDPQKLALAMMSAIQGGLLLSQAHGDTEPLEVAFATMLRYIQSFQAVSISSRHG